jgi:hypothetical protein
MSDFLRRYWPSPAYHSEGQKRVEHAAARKDMPLLEELLARDGDILGRRGVLSSKC